MDKPEITEGKSQFWVQVIADEVMKYPDIRLQMLIRNAVLQYTKYDLTLDQAVAVLETELDYIKSEIRAAVTKGGKTE